MFRLGTSLLVVLGVLSLGNARPALSAEETRPLTVVVLDPLAAPLSCPCVKGYAQRDYTRLETFLGRELQRTVKVYFAESLTVALEKKTAGPGGPGHRASLGGGAEAPTHHLGLATVAALTDRDGRTSQKGLFLVALGDPALLIGDLKGYQLFLGPASCEEKHAAALAVLESHGISQETKPEIYPRCSETVTRMLERHRQGQKAVAVVSSSSQPLLEGCGIVRKGEVRVIGATAPVPFVMAFVNDRLPARERKTLTRAPLRVGKVPGLCSALESKLGFVLPEEDRKPGKENRKD